MAFSEQSEHKESSYKSVGKFTVNFQKIIFGLQMLISSVFQRKGLVEPQLLEVLYADRTAMDIWSCARGLFNFVYNPTEEEKPITEGLFKRIHDIIEYRNDIEHGFLMVGFTHVGQADLTEFPHLRVKKGKSGPIFAHIDMSYKTIDEKADEAYALASEVFQMRGFFMLRGTPHEIPVPLHEYIKRDVNSL